MPKLRLGAAHKASLDERSNRLPAENGPNSDTLSGSANRPIIPI